MWNYLGRRLLTSLSILIGVSVLTFLMIHVMPGDPVKVMTGRLTTSPERIEQLREELGFNAPIPVQYLKYVERFLRGDMGTSIRNNRPVFSQIREQLPSTVKLALLTITISTILGIFVGLISAATKYSVLDRVLSFVSLTVISIPTYFLALLLILLFSVRLKWVPAVARADDPRGIILPSISLALGEAFWLGRIVRNSVIEEANKAYPNLAKSKGVSRVGILVRHILPNVLIPIATAISIQLVYILAGSVVIESIFARQGIGSLAVLGIKNQDFPLIQGTVTIMAAIYVVVNTVTDLFYAVVDPRVRLG